MKDEKDGEADTREAGCVIPAKLFAEIGHGKNGEDGKSDHFLDDLELGRGEFERADAVGGDLKAVFKERDAPTGEDDFPEGFAAIFEMAVPGEGHKNIGNSEKKDCTHAGFVSCQKMNRKAQLYLTGNSLSEQ